MELLASPAFWVSLTTLTFLEIVLGIDNLLFVSIAVGKLQGRQQTNARRFGVWAAMVLRILMLMGIFWIIRLEATPLFDMPAQWPAMLGMHDRNEVREFIAFTVKDLILLAGGIFLLWKGTQEIHTAVYGVEQEQKEARSDYASVLVQLVVINIVFSLDSVITAVGMTDLLAVMIAAVVLSTFVMAFAAEPLGNFIEQHPTVKMLALAFILLVGVALVADGLGFHIPRGYLYFAIAFSLAVELLNIRSRAKTVVARRTDA
ncbi:MAG: TerC family protein [Proteobacteria bacterium]|nr:TerC family protein [Pseudomonadota bacterium]